MKLKIRYLFPFIVLLLSSSLIRAQEPVQAVDSLYVAFWPDYDAPSVLVLMTGDLPPDAPLPAEVTIPIPPGAEVNAVARVGEEGMADTPFAVNGDTLTLTTPDPRFRVEFYVPYEEDGDQHSFDYTWDAGIDVEEFIAEIQQPLNATSLATVPLAATSGVSPNDGLTYHALPAQTLPAGTPFALSFRYDMANPGLTAGAPAPTIPDTVPSGEAEQDGAPDIDWLLVGAGLVILLLVIVVTWLLATRNNGGRRSGKSSKPRKPAPKERAAKARFCHNCGAEAEKGDQFCRTCGTKLKS